MVYAADGANISSVLVRPTFCEVCGSTGSFQCIPDPESVDLFRDTEAIELLIVTIGEAMKRGTIPFQVSAESNIILT